MIRYGVAFLLLASSAVAAVEPAYSQVVQYQFSPPPPVVPLPSTPSYSQGLGIASPAPAPGPSAEPYLFSPSPRFVQVPGRAPVVVPPLQSGPSDGITNCLQAGAAAGLGANELGGFTNQCLN